ncbi:MAG: sporulation protein YqfD [Clostridia bacterium]|nr:sporulation protein YqfD [Clostridia bacterium]
MFLVELLRFFTGYAEFTGTGGFSERFINLCSVYDIPLWNITYYNGYFTACTSVEGYMRIAVCARNSGVKVRKNRSVGLPFILKKLRPRIGLLFGAIFFVVCLSILSNKVWVISISGNETIPTDTILSAAESAGLQLGRSTDKLNVVQLSLDTCEKVSGISWAAIRVNGCCVYIDVTEAEASPEIESKEGTYNIVASKDAQLIILEPYRGTPQAKIFNSVMKGDILISAVTPNRDESVSLVHASGYAVGRTETEITASSATSLNCAEYIPIRNVYTAHFFGLDVPLGKPPEDFSQKFTQSKMMAYSGKTLPIGFSRTEYYSLKTKAKKISPAQAKLKAASDFMNSASDFSQGKQIIKSKINFSENGSSATVTGEFICYENIGTEALFEAETTSYQE